jgi:hypothetical protein
MNKPIFYLASSEGYGLEEPRACYLLRRIQTESRSDWLLVRIDPPIVGQRYGLGSKDIDRLLIAPRHSGVDLLESSDWPMYVHVARVLESHRDVDSKLSRGDYQEIGWAEIHPTKTGAR